MIVPTWVPIGLPWHEFKCSHSLCTTGVVIELAAGPERILIGEINTMGGYCDDCSIERDAMVVRALDLRDVIETLIANALGASIPESTPPTGGVTES